MGFLSGITSFVKEHSDVIHGVLDLAGFIPGVGAVADLANAAVYAVEGDYMNAALSVVSAVPGIGDTVALAKKSTKAIKGGVKAMKNMKALTKAEKMKGLFGLLRGKAQTGAKKLAGKFTDMKTLFRDLKNGDKKLCLFGKCFTGDTLVYTKQGYVPIKDIRKGDDIYSRNAETGETGFKEVEEVFRTGAHTIYHIWLEGKEEIKTTAYHPIYVEEKGWVNAINLQEGDPVQTMEGTARITRIEKNRYEEPVPVYNFHVKDWMSYFVSKMRIFVHNKIKVHSKNGTLLPGEGNIGTYKELKDAGEIGDNITPHHMPSRKYMERKNVGKNEGLCMNMEMPSPGKGGRHRLTDTYGRNMTDAEKAHYYSLSPRDALAYDLKNLKKIYKEQGLYSEIRPKLQEYIKEYKKYMPNLFEK